MEFLLLFLLQAIRGAHTAMECFGSVVSGWLLEQLVWFLPPANLQLLKVFQMGAEFCHSQYSRFEMELFPVVLARPLNLLQF